MSNNIKKIVESYYNELGQAFKSGVINFANLNLDDQVSVIAPTEKFAGKDVVQNMLKELVKIVEHFDIQRKYFDEESACIVMDCVVKYPPYHIATIEWMLIKDGKIMEIHPVYDTVAWQKLLENIPRT